MQKKIFLSTCISLTLAAFLGCKNSNNDTQSNDQQNTKAVSSNFAASYGDDFNYYASGYKKCELDSSKEYFNNVKNLNFSTDKNCVVNIDKIILESKNFNGEKIDFTKVSPNEIFVFKAGEDGLFKNKISPILFRSHDEKYEIYLNIRMNKENIVFYTSEPKISQIVIDKNDILINKGNKISLLDNIKFHYSSDSIPTDFVTLKINSYFDRLKGSSLFKYNDKTTNIKKIFDEKYKVTDFNCKISDHANFSNFERSDLSKLEGCLSKNLQLNKSYSLVYTQSGSWNDSKLWYAEFSFEEYSLEPPSLDLQLLKKEQDELTFDFKTELDDYIKNIYTPNCNKYNNENNRVRKLTILNNKFKRFYKYLDDKYEYRSHKNYIPQGFQFSVDEINVLTPINTSYEICSSEGNCIQNYNQICPNLILN
ncbi:hypothetical protein QEJ31_08605 [Pigmentibacter sp. JX0631]|uniref:hypothetical protein n=1 Tax=Pigmentibacter sp. JX0631 TaxID=2976982 RepID=UPI002468DC33|nr:hypothetical protein [Pigmentibacter sp. JX0631]WGL58595.1 hypothetical protein QEJ31_08605 [Pigmentibacter sp. JX0631]